MNPIAVMFALGALAVIFPAMYYAMRQQNQTISGVVAAQQLHAITDAAQAYVIANAANVQTIVNGSGSLTLCVPSTPGTCPAGQPDLTQGYLPLGFRPQNPYGQSWSVIVGKDVNGNLEALVESSGGTPIDGTNIARIAAEGGASGGMVGGGAGVYSVAGCSTGFACGAYAGWQLALNAPFTNPGAGHLVSLLDFNGAGTALNSDYLYRVTVAGHPELNAMQTDLSMTDTSGVAHNITGAANVTASGTVQAATVAASSALSAGTGFTANSAGSVTASTNLAVGSGFTASSAGAVSVKNSIALGTSAGATPGGACSPNGLMAANADGSGQILSCQFGAWVPIGGHWLRYGYYAVQDYRLNATNNPVPAPNCPGGGTPEITVLPSNFYVDTTATVNYGAVGAGPWTVYIQDGSGNPISGATAIVGTYCSY